MREIKFRAWNNCRNEYLFDVGVNPCVEQIVSDGEWADEWDKYVIEQFTGLRDRHGKDIYEGDIISIADGYKEIIVNGQGPIEPFYHLCPVIWIPQFACFGIHIFENGDVYKKGMYNFGEIHDIDDEIKVEIIGNIHENRELLEDIK
jgi:uncharacterized phage protein (TIGR01671 family)